MTVLTAFFLHAGWLHLLGNLYFLVVFGDDVERELGPARFVLLLLAGTILGAAVHALADPRSTTPRIGASAGISSVVAFYALAFPGRRVYVGITDRFLGAAAQWLFVLWIAQQCLLAYLQVQGFGSVSALAHGRRHRRCGRVVEVGAHAVS